MKIQRYTVVLALLAGLWSGLTPAWGVNKEMVQLQTQVQDLQDRIAHMQQSFDERMGVMQHLTPTRWLHQLRTCRPRCRSSRPTAARTWTNFPARSSP